MNLYQLSPPLVSRRLQTWKVEDLEPKTPNLEKQLRIPGKTNPEYPKANHENIITYQNPLILTMLFFSPQIRASWSVLRFYEMEFPTSSLRERDLMLDETKICEKGSIPFLT